MRKNINNIKSVFGNDTNSLHSFVSIIILNTLIFCFGLWTTIEFILYLVKDHPFNWVSLWLTIIMFIIMCGYVIRTVIKF